MGRGTASTASGAGGAAGAAGAGAALVLVGKVVVLATDLVRHVPQRTRTRRRGARGLVRVRRRLLVRRIVRAVVLKVVAVDLVFFQDLRTRVFFATQTDAAQVGFTPYDTQILEDLP